MRTPLRRYYHGRNLVAMRDVQAGTTRYYHFNHQGTVQCLTNEQGQVTDRFAADAWGRQVKRTGTSINRQWYIGHLGYYREVDRVLDYVRMRWLDPARGRWLSAEPLRLYPLWAYAANSPAANVDPSGLQWMRGQFRYVPPLPDPSRTFNTKRPSLVDRARCALVGTGILALLCQEQAAACPVLFQFISHWYSKSGNTWKLSVDVMYKLMTQGNHDMVCNGFATKAAAFAESILPECPPAARGPSIRPLHPIWHRGALSGSAPIGDRDLWNAIGNSQAWARAGVGCECDPVKGDIFYMDLTYMITDQFVGSDPAKMPAYECHLFGLVRDFIIEGKWEREALLTWRRGRFAQDVPKPCP